MIPNLLKKLGFGRLAFAAGVGFSLLMAITANAQAPSPAPAGGTAEAERVIVTGSLIPTAEEVGPNPIFALNRDLINKSGSGTTTEQLLQRQPIMNGANIPVQNNGTGQSGPTGAAAVALRGFDPGATLVLIDRRRVAPFPGAANSGYGFVDLTSIPITAVQSIDILKDGASTTYGADAVAGVVNLNMYKDYRGAQMTVQYGDSLTDNGPKGFKSTDEAEYKADLLFGVGDDNTSITGDIFYYKHHSMFNRDRTNSFSPPFLSSNSEPWNLQLRTQAVLNPFDVNGNPEPAPTLPPGLLTRSTIFGTPPDGSNGFSPASDYVYNSRRVRSSILPGFNFNLYSSSYPQQERWGGYAAFEHKICDDQLRLFGDFYYVDSKTHDELAPEATGSFQTPGSPTRYIPPNHPFADPANPDFGGPTPAQVGMPDNAFNPFNPFEQIISGGSRARLLDFGNRQFDNENVAERFTTGVKGDKLFGGSWGYDGAFMYSQLQQTSLGIVTDGGRVNRILNANDSLFNPVSTDYIGQTTPYNPFGDGRSVQIASNQPLLEFATQRNKGWSTSKLATLDLNIYTTELFDLPAGGVGLAFGGSFNRESYNVQVDDQTRIENGIPNIAAGRKSWGIYAETLVPVFSPKWEIPGFHALEISAGVRYDEWLNNDTNAAVPKVGVRWQPFDESLTIRSTWGEGFLEPSMVQLYGPKRFLLAPLGGTTCAPVALFGPCGSPNNAPQDLTNPETTVEQIPNRDLHPEHDRSWTAGFVYTPKWIPSKWGTLTLTLDLWDVERSGVVMYLNPSTIVNNYNAAGYPTSLAIVSPANPTTASPPSTLFDSEGGFSGVSAPYQNGGRMRANGFDLGAQYQIETDYGTFSILSRWSYLNEFVVNFPHSTPRQAAGSSSTEWYIGSYFGDVTNPQAWLKWRGDTSLDWTWHNWDVTWTWHFLDGYHEQFLAQQFDGIYKQHWVDATNFVDAQVSYTQIFTPPVEAAPVPGYSKGKEVVAGKGKEAPVTEALPCWKAILNNTTITAGVSNIADSEPPSSFGFEFGNSIGYPGSLYDNIGRFCYVRLVKKF